jgi:hypothetical protein
MAYKPAEASLIRTTMSHSGAWQYMLHHRNPFALVCHCLRTERPPARRVAISRSMPSRSHCLSCSGSHDRPRPRNLRGFNWLGGLVTLSLSGPDGVHSDDCVAKADCAAMSGPTAVWEEGYNWLVAHGADGAKRDDRVVKGDCAVASGPKATDGVDCAVLSEPIGPKVKEGVDCAVPSGPKVKDGVDCVVEGGPNGVGDERSDGRLVHGTDGGKRDDCVEKGDCAKVDCAVMSGPSANGGACVA